MAGLYGFFLVWLRCGGYGTVEMVGGWLFSFLLSFIAVNFLCGLMFAVGFLRYILRFPSVNLWFFSWCFCVLEVIDFQ
jgi:hypothetical protein